MSYITVDSSQFANSILNCFFSSISFPSVIKLDIQISPRGCKYNLLRVTDISLAAVP